MAQGKSHKWDRKKTAADSLLLFLPCSISSLLQLEGCLAGRELKYTAKVRVQIDPTALQSSILEILSSTRQTPLLGSSSAGHTLIIINPSHELFVTWLFL